MQIIYNLFIYLYYSAIWLYSLFNNKAKLWIEGRKGWERKLINTIPKNSKIIWVHCSSLGEFEQGRTVIEALKKTNQDYYILLTFFSPSGFEIRKNYELANLVCYLPLDTKANSKKFIEIIKPSIAIFVKYEFWFNYLQTLKQHDVNTIFISSIFRENQYFFKPYGKWFLNHLKNVNHIFLQDENSYKVLVNNSFNNISIAGDTRFDRVFELANSTPHNQTLQLFANGNKLLVAGSTWLPDEQLLLQSFKRLNEIGYKLVIAPHVVDEQNINKLITLFKIYQPIKYSNFEANTTAQVLIIDNIGMLMQLYKNAHIAYVGGGFGNGIHNVLEPTTFGVPTAFGPKHHKFKEAVSLLKIGAACCVSTSNEITDFATTMLDDTSRKELSDKCTQFITQNTGATSKIIEYLTK